MACSVWNTQPSARGSSSFPTRRPSLPAYSRSGSFRTETITFTGRKAEASTARKLGSAMKDMTARGRCSLMSLLRAFMRLRFLLSRDCSSCSCSMEMRSTPSGTGYSQLSTKLVTSTERQPAWAKRFASWSITRSAPPSWMAFI